MPPEEKDPGLVWDIVRYARTVVEMASDRSFDDFLADDQFRLASERCIELIGEAAAHLSAPFRQRSPHIPWAHIVGLRNIIVHGYAQLDHAKLWSVVKNDVPQLLNELSPVVEDADDPPAC